MIMTRRDTRNSPNCGLNTERKDDSTSRRCELEGSLSSRRETTAVVTEMARIIKKARMPRVIHSQSRAPVLPINAPVTAIITAPPAASDMIFMDEAMPMRFSGTQSLINARPGP